MQAAAAAIVASKEGIQQCSVVLREFPMAKYTQYIELKGQETQLKQKDVHLNKEQLEIDSNRFGLKQKEDEHPMRVDGDRAELEDRSAKRRRFNSSTDDGITSEACLQRPQKGSVMHRGLRTKRVGMGSVQGFEVADHRQSLATAVQHRSSRCYSQLHNREPCC